MATSSKAIPITVGKVTGSSDANPEIQRMAEKAALTVKIGTPVLLSGGYVIEAPTINDGTDQVAGICHEPGSNLASDGVAKTLTYGSVQNQASAVLIPIGAPPNDGRIGVLIARQNNVFQGVLGNSSSGSESVAATDLGAIFGLTKDANGFWYVDKNITAVNSGACVEVVELLDAVGTLNGKVLFRFAAVRQQLAP